jgi:hypothetical protein
MRVIRLVIVLVFGLTLPLVAEAQQAGRVSWLPPPWVFFALGGATLAILSAILSGYLASIQAKKIESLDADIMAVEREITFGKAADDAANSKLQFAEMMMVLLDSSEAPQEVLLRHRLAVSQRVVEAVLSTGGAATGEPLAREVLAQVEPLNKRFIAGAPDAFQQLIKYSDNLRRAWAERNNELVKKRDGLKIKKAIESRRLDQIRYAAIALQILGLIVVLLKDVVKP